MYYHIENMSELKPSYSTLRVGYPGGVASLGLIICSKGPMFIALTCSLQNFKCLFHGPPRHTFLEVFLWYMTWFLGANLVCTLNHAKHLKDIQLSCLF